MIETLIKANEVEKDQIYVEAVGKQIVFIEAALSGLYTHLFYGGAVGGMKTVTIIILFSILCKVYPGSRWVIIRKDRPVLERNTIPSFWKFCPKPFFHPTRYNRTRMEATATNGSQIIFMSENLKQYPDLTNFDGLEVNGAAREECQELSEALDLKLIDRVGRWVVKGAMPPILHLYSANPTQKWIKTIFYTPYTNNTLPDMYFYLPALPYDNPFLTDAYRAALETLKERAPNLYRKRVQGSWDAEDDIQQLISWETIWACEKLIEFIKPEYIPEENTGNIQSDETYRAMGVDVGRFGPDASAWYVLEGNYEKGFNIIHTEKFPKTSVPQVEQKTKELIIDWEIPHHRVFLDVVGLGAGAYDHLVEDGYEIQAFSGGSADDDDFQLEHPDLNQKQIYFNMNSRVGWEVKVLMEAGKIGGIESQELRDDIGVYRYDIKGEKTIHLWGKDLIKKELHRSPDDGDAFKYAVWGAIYDKVGLMPGVIIV